MVRGRFYSGQDDLAELLKIREMVFCQELQMDPDVENDGQDDYCMHVLAFDNEQPVAVGRIAFDGWNFVISRVAVLPEHRGKKYGDFVVRMLIDKAMMSNAKQVQLDALEGTEGFFETIGFQTEKDAGVLGDKKLVHMVLNTDAIHKCCSCK